VRGRSDHCPAMKGIETSARAASSAAAFRSDHCPAMKGIETGAHPRGRGCPIYKKRPLPRNEGD